MAWQIVNSQRIKDPAKFHRRVTELALGMSVFLVVIKIGAWWLSGAVSLLATALDSGLDVVASLVNLMALRVAQIPADDDHGFGHGKAEPLAGLAQTLFIGISATLLVRDSIASLQEPAVPRYIFLCLLVSFISVILTFVLTRLQTEALRLAQSVAVAADRAHYLGDFYLNMGVIISLALVGLMGWAWLDGVFGLGVALYLFWMARGIFIDSWHMLMDRELPDNARAQIQQICSGRNDIIGIQNLKTRRSGPDSYIQFDLMLDGNLTLAAAHRIGESIEAEIAQQFPAAHILIHHEPVEIEARGLLNKPA